MFLNQNDVLIHKYTFSAQRFSRFFGVKFEVKKSLRSVIFEINLLKQHNVINCIACIKKVPEPSMEI